MDKETQEAVKQARSWTKPVDEIVTRCDECNSVWVDDRKECPICGHNWQKVALEVDQAVEDTADYIPGYDDGEYEKEEVEA